jgi:addiction module RelB/DinJ family antitoxin
MKNAIINVKVDANVKLRAQAVASSFGIPLSTLINAYLIELADTGQVHFSAVEIMTPKMEEIIKKAQQEIETGKTVGPFSTAEEAIDYLKSV